jgi:ACS family glucarate transporter-like MFS transporter
VRYLVLVWLCLAATIAYVQRNSLGVVEKEMREELQLTMNESAWVIGGGFFFSYALLQVPAGWLGHVWGTRRALSVFTLVCATATGLFAIVTGLPALILCRLTMGAGQAGLFPCTTGTIKTWFPGSQWGMSNGFLTAFMQVGAAAGAVAAGSLNVAFGWRWTFGLLAIPGLVWAVWFYIWFRDRPQDHPAVNAGEIELLAGTPTAAAAPLDEPADERIPWGVILTSSALGWICTQQFFRGAGYIFYSSWFTTYLKASRGVAPLKAGLLTSLPLWTFALGSLAGGTISDWLLVRTGSRRISRQGLAIASQFFCAVFVLIAYTVHDSTAAVLIISVGSGCAAIAGPIAYAITIDMGGNHVRTVFSVMNMAGNIGSFAFPFVVAWLVGEGPNASWDKVLPVFAAIYVLAGVCWLGFNPDRPIVPVPAIANGTSVGG